MGEGGGVHSQFHVTLFYTIFTCRPDEVISRDCDPVWKGSEAVRMPE